MTKASIQNVASRVGDEKTRSTFPRVATARHIIKIGVVVTANGRLLLVRKKGSKLYILPGGKPETGEDDIQALSREITEELGCSLRPQSIQFLGTFSDKAAELKNTFVTIKLYAASLLGEPKPLSEIESLKWYSPHADDSNVLAPSLQNKILPFLCSEGGLNAEKEFS